MIFAVCSIKCYQCNSNDNSDCTSLPVYENKNAHTIEPTECTGNATGQEPFCRKVLYSGKQLKYTKKKLIKYHKQNINFSIRQQRRLARPSSKKLRLHQEQIRLSELQQQRPRRIGVSMLRRRLQFGASHDNNKCTNNCIIFYHNFDQIKPQ